MPPGDPPGALTKSERPAMGPISLTPATVPSILVDGAPVAMKPSAPTQFLAVGFHVAPAAKTAARPSSEKPNAPSCTVASRLTSAALPPATNPRPPVIAGDPSIGVSPAAVAAP